jgi:hypothetical protein
MRALFSAILFAAAATAIPAAAAPAPETSAAAPAPDANPAPKPPQRSCRRLAGSDTVTCTTQPQQGAYRIPRLRPSTYGPALPSAQADLGQGVRARLRGQSNGRRTRSAATLSVPF